MRREAYFEEDWAAEQMENLALRKEGGVASPQGWTEEAAMRKDMKKSQMPMLCRTDDADRAAIALARMPHAERPAFTLYHEMRTLTLRGIEKRLKLKRDEATRLLRLAHVSFHDGWHVAAEAAKTNDRYRPERRASA